MGAERRGNSAKKIAARGAATVGTNRVTDVGAEPATTSFALRIDALNGEAGQVLHGASYSAANFAFASSAECDRPFPDRRVWRGFWGEGTLCVKRKGHNL